MFIPPQLAYPTYWLYLSSDELYSSWLFLMDSSPPFRNSQTKTFHMTDLKTFDWGLSHLPWTPCLHDPSCGTELPSTLGPLPWNCCHLTCPSSIWSPGLGPALHMWRLYSILVTMRRILNVLQWKINQGRVTQLQAGEDFWVLLSLASITELRFPILCYKNTG